MLLLLLADAEPDVDAPAMSTFAFATFGLLLLLAHDDELDVELAGLCRTEYLYNGVNFGGFGLSLLDDDSDLCSGKDARRPTDIAATPLNSVTVGNVGNE